MDSDDDDRFSADYEQEMEVMEPEVNKDSVVEIVILSTEPIGNCRQTGD
jgi:hypothetical protein